MTGKPASSEIYIAAGSPPMKNTKGGKCCLCGMDSYGIGFSDWARATFMDFDKLKAGAIICSACQFCSEDGSALLQEKLGRGKPQRMRNYSHFVIGTDWHVYHKGQKREILVALHREPKIAVIALSGQKHILFRARPGWWQIEEQSCIPRLLVLRGKLCGLARLYRRGLRLLG